jgi:hypothetical protein
VFLAAALAFAGQARALGASSGQAAGSTGGPQAVYELHPARDGAPAMNEKGSAGLPTWYSADVTLRTPPPREPTMLVERSGSVPSWYAID